LVIRRAKENGVKAIITSALDYNGIKFSERLIVQYNGYIYRTIGLDYTVLDKSLFEEIVSYIERNRNTIVGIGEVGLDYYVFEDEEKRKIQREFFINWINLAKELDLPLIVHSRSAGKYALESLIQNNAERVIMHAFDGKASYVKNVVSKWYLFSIPPSIARSEQKQKLVKALPIESLLLESDAPVLAPIKDARNEPVNIKISAEWISKLKNISINTVIEKTTENARKIFKLY
ncbi:MAG: TatD family hydrolase, partial [Nitrososphaeria archaeon]